MTNKHPVQDLHYIKLLRENPEYRSRSSYNKTKVLFFSLFFSFLLIFISGWIIDESNNLFFGILYIFFIFLTIVLFFVNIAYAIYNHIMAEKEIKEHLKKNQK